MIAPGPGHERDRQGKGCDVADMVDRHSVVRDFSLTLAAQRKQHVEGDVEQQEPTSNAKCGDGDAERLQCGPAAEGEGGENREGNDAGAQCDLALLHPGHAERETNEDRARAPAGRA